MSCSTSHNCTQRIHFWYQRRGKHFLCNNRLVEQENLLDVLTGMIKVFTFDAYALLDPGASLYFLNTYIENQFEILPTKICELFFWFCWRVQRKESIMIFLFQSITRTPWMIQHSQTWQILISFYVWTDLMPFMD